MPAEPWRNNFSVLRISFAALVILSHSSELIYGNRSHEPLTMIFGTISLGDVAVDGFFVISGYLITKSFLSSEPAAYLAKRILRIYPGFIAAFVASIVVCVYFSPDAQQTYVRALASNTLNVIFLMSPNVESAYPGSPYPAAKAPCGRFPMMSAYLSWTAIEKPCLALKAKLLRHEVIVT